VLRLHHRDSGRPVEDLVPVAMLNEGAVAFPPAVLLKAKDESSFPVEGGVAPRWQDGRMEGAVIALRGTTHDAAEYDQARRDAKQEALERLADRIVRELPDMSALAQQSVRLVDALPADSPLREQAQAIERAALDAFGVSCRVRSFLAPVELQVGRVAVNEILTHLADAWKQLEPNLILKVAGEPLTAEADEWQLTRARIAPASPLTIEGAAGADQQAGKITIRIIYASQDEDAGSLERLFEPSCGEESSELSVAYRLVQQMGGRIAARFEAGVITFEVLLEAAAEAKAALAGPDQPAVLLIEPSAAIRRLLHEHLEGHGYRVLEAPDAEQALLAARLYRAPIPLAIANSRDPEDPAGAALEQELLAARPECRVRMLSGYRDQGEPARPLTKWDLLAWVEEAFRSLKPGGGNEERHGSDEQKPA
jgi:CheY-like chemotaxis protein